MTDLVVGLGEIGMPIYQLLKQRNFDVYGYDIDPFKTVTNKAQVTVKGHYDMIHICFPFESDEQFKKSMQFNDLNTYREMTNHLVIHSTVGVGTSKKYNAIYSPVRGVHHDMFECIKEFVKYYAWGRDLIEFERRFPKSIRVSDTDKLELTKHVLVARYAAEMALSRMFEEKYPHYKELTFELNQKYGILPVYYNDHKKFGGHCIVPNIDLLNDDLVKTIVGDLGGY